MRLEQKAKLAPRMIQSMEILQLPVLALQGRIEQELNTNPVLETAEPGQAESPSLETETDDDMSPRELVVSPEGGQAEDFRRLENLGDDFKDYLEQSGPIRRKAQGEADPKLEAIKNTAAPDKSLHDHLLEQWMLVDAKAAVRKAGVAVIDNIDERGYLNATVEELAGEPDCGFSTEDADKAIKLVQKLEPTGVGARSLKECLLIQTAQSSEDMSLEAMLIENHMDNLLENRLPEIAARSGLSMKQINRAIERMSKLDTSPGLQVGQRNSHPVAPDAVVETVNGSDEYVVRLADSDLPRLSLNDYYVKMAGNPDTAIKTRRFLRDNIRSARWIMEAVEQRKNTLLAVTRSIVKHQKEFFDKGPQYLKPLPMSTVANDVGVHLATVSRAVGGKYLQCPWGMIPLRKFFSGGTESEEGRQLSWEAVRAKLQQIIDNEDKTKPLSDDKILAKLRGAGIHNLARRTVAKYRKLLGIPPARLRRRY